MPLNENFVDELHNFTNSKNREEKKLRKNEKIR